MTTTIYANAEIDGNQYTNPTAYNLGLKDGAAAVREADDSSAEAVAAWFAPGQLGPDEGLINALGQRDLYRALGLTREQGDERGIAWDSALASYNRGYRDGANAEAYAQAAE